MARPITWQNINSRSNEGVVDMMDSAGESVNQGFTGFDKLIQGVQKTRSDNRDQTIDNNTQSFLNRLQGIQDPEEMARLQASGELQQQREELGPMIDQEATRGAIRDRLTGLRETQTTNREYADSETQFGNRDAMSNAQAALASGNLAKFDEITANNDFLKPGELAQQRAETVRRIKGETQSAEDRERRLAAEATARERSGIKFGNYEEDRAEAAADEAEAEEEADLITAAQTRRDELAATTNSPAAFRAALQEEFQPGGAFEGLPSGQRKAMIAEAEPLWEQGNGLLEGQGAKVDTFRQSQLQEAERQIAQKEVTLQETKKQNPVDENLAFMDENRVSLSDSLAYVENFEESGIDHIIGGSAKAATEDAIAATIKDRTPDENLNVPWGNIARMAIDAAKVKDTGSDGYDLETDDIKKQMKVVYDDWLKSHKNRQTVLDAERSFIDEKADVMSEVDAKTAQERQRYKQLNTDLTNLRGNK